MPDTPWMVTRRQVLKALGLGVAGVGTGVLTASELLAAPPAVPRNTAFLQWVGAQTQKPARFEFCVLGDNRPNTRKFDQIAALTNNQRPAFNIHVGDIVEGGTADQWNLVSPSLQAFAAPMIATLGNHDRNLAGPKGRDMELWGAEWGAGQWDFRVGGWHFVGFDTSMGRVTKEQLAWLDQVLADNQPTMVFTHYPVAVDRWKVHALTDGTTPFLALL
ncbi:MAG: metallophosphoesterase, partial [bacterium]